MDKIKDKFPSPYGVTVIKSERFGKLCIFYE